MSQTECILWVPNQRDDPPAVSYSHDGVIILPSRVGLEDIGGVGNQRIELPRPGTIETDCHVVSIERNCIAWPTSDTVTFEAPGFNQPVEVTWQSGITVKGEVIFPGFNQRVTIIPGRPDKFSLVCPQQRSAKLWATPPSPGTTTLCYIGYYISQSRPVGYAWPARSEHLNRVFNLPRGMFLVDPTGAELELRVTVLEKKGEMNIIIRS